MKVIAFNGSPREDGNTQRALRMALDELEKEGIETELVNMGREPVAPCEACGVCRKTKDGKCKIIDDRVNEFVAKIALADGIIIGSPVYYGTMSAQTKAFIDRVGYVCGASGILKRKVGAAVAVNRRAGALATFQEINNFFLIAEMIVVGSSYWNVLVGLGKGDVDADEEGRRIMSDLGRNMAWLLKRIV
ncbi:FMN reductase [Methanomassiliicoccales archaeon RumEn M1]|jgi:multimeric flavodoxin WrbA|nr:FMN reductase [Methanomassiliicoccales archaeon RumEn M1]